MHMYYVINTSFLTKISLLNYDEYFHHDTFILKPGNSAHRISGPLLQDL